MNRLALIFAACFLAASAHQPQEPELAVLVPDTSIDVRLGPGDPVLPGFGPSRSFTCTTDYSGGLYVRTWSEELELLVQVEDGEGQVSSGRDSGPEHGTGVLVGVEPGATFLVRVASLRPEAEGRLDLVLVAARDTEATRAAAELARDALGEIASLRREGDLDGARAVLEEVVSQVVTLPGADQSQPLSLVLHDVAKAADELGLLRASAAAHGVVLAHCERALPADHYILQGVRGDLAATLAVMGDLRGARELLEKVLPVRLRLLPEEDALVQIARQDLAGVLAWLGDLARARELYEQVFAVHARTLPEEDRRLQEARANLAAVLRLQGDLLRARELQERVLAVYQRKLADGDAGLQMARMNLANTLSDLGDLPRTRELAEKALEVYSRTLPPDHPDLQSAREKLALALDAAGEGGRARELFEQALAVRSRTLPPDHPDLQYSRANLAEELRAAGETARARELQETVVEVFTRTLPPDHPDLQKARASLASILRDQGALGRARELQEEVVAVLSQRFPADHPDVLVERRSLAWILAALDEREACSAQALALARGLREAARNWILVLAPREIEMRAVQLGGEASSVLSLARGAGCFPPDQALEREALALVESLRGMGLCSALALPGSRTDPATIALRDEVRAASEELVRLARSDGGRDAIAAARGRKEEAERVLLRKAMEAGVPASSRDADVDALSACVQPGEALVSFWRYSCQTMEREEPGELRAEARMCAFVIRHGGAFTRVELGPLRDIDAAVERWRDAVVGEGGRDERGVGLTLGASGASELEAGTSLRELVFDPLAPALEGVQRVIVAPEDVLLAVPLDALPDGDPESPAGGARLLGDRLTIELRPTLWELLSERGAPDGREVLLLGGIDYDAEPDAPAQATAEALDAGAARPSATLSSGAPAVLRGTRGKTSFSFLPGTAGEVAALAELEHGELGLRVLTARQASRAALVALAPRARFLHLATHGWFAPDSVRSLEDPRATDGSPVNGPPARRAGLTPEQQMLGASPLVLCGLALAGANLAEGAGGCVTGMITAEELSTLDLTGCELAVLSACDTSVGVRRAGQGVASLQRALHMAGARTVITSLWMVPDEATRELMVDFYRRIWVEKQPKARALWEAKKRIRDARDESGQPLYSKRDWAAWVLTGEPE